MGLLLLSLLASKRQLYLGAWKAAGLATPNPLSLLASFWVPSGFEAVGEVTDSVKSSSSTTSEDREVFPLA